MPFVADTHVHIYPWYDLARVFQVAEYNLKRLTIQLARIYGVSAEDIIETRRIIVLTERHDCHFFRDLWNGDISIPEGFVVSRPTGSPCVEVTRDGTHSFYIIPGRQIITRERIEVLALGKDVSIVDGQGVSETISAVKEGECLCVLPWSPGKWTGVRGSAICSVFQASNRNEIFLGDIAIRPAGFPIPGLLGQGQKRGFRLICGSDPLPNSSDQELIGSFGIASPENVSPVTPADSVLELLRSPHVGWKEVGWRSGPVAAAIRLFKNELSRRRLVR